MGVPVDATAALVFGVAGRYILGSGIAVWGRCNDELRAASGMVKRAGDNAERPEVSRREGGRKAEEERRRIKGPGEHDVVLGRRGTRKSMSGAKQRAALAQQKAAELLYPGGSVASRYLGVVSLLHFTRE